MQFLIHEQNPDDKSNLSQILKAISFLQIRAKYQLKPI